MRAEVCFLFVYRLTAKLTLKSSGSGGIVFACFLYFVTWTLNISLSSVTVMRFERNTVHGFKYTVTSPSILLLIEKFRYT